MLTKIFNYFLDFFTSKKSIKSVKSEHSSSSGGESKKRPKTQSNITPEDLSIVKTKELEENAIAYAQINNEDPNIYKTWLKEVLQQKYQNYKIDDQYMIDYSKYLLYRIYLNSSFSNQEQKTILPYIKKIFEKTCDDLKNKDPKIEENPFFNLYRYGVSKINTTRPMTSNAKSNFYVHNSKIKGHASYFVFEVDKDTRNIKAISYCDGNPISIDRIISNNQINGVITFQVKDDLEFSKKFVDDFIEKNSQDFSKEDFYKKLETNSLDFLQAEVDQNAKEHSVECQRSKRGNCGLKSINLLQRFLIDQTENRSDQEKKELYKDFKKQLTLSSLDQLVTITNKAFERDYLPNQEIDKDPLKIDAIDSLKKYYYKAQEKNNEEAKAIIEKLSEPVQQIIGISSKSQSFTLRSSSRKVSPLIPL